MFFFFALKSFIWLEVCSRKVPNFNDFIYTAPVAKVDIEPQGENNEIDVVEGDTIIFTCTTNPSRPAAWIHWFIGGLNVTNKTQSQVSNEHGGTFISFSTWNYTGKSDDHNKIVFCETANIAERQTISSLNKSLVIKFGPKNILLNTTKTEYTVTEQGSMSTIICSANCRPNCTFNWTGPNGLASDNSALTLGAVYRNQTGEYICNANNFYGSLSTHEIVLIVNLKKSLVYIHVHVVRMKELLDHRCLIQQMILDGRPHQEISEHLTSLGIKHASARTISHFCSENGITWRCGVDEGALNNIVAECVKHVRKEGKILEY
ncbi:Hypothetical predicted protein [Mytilus galloprovincialis]|uniref:Ig-like domain-containing protein n=1 Tax=Mytilus galloprovincialis TaxID=29158 RepID=A0A8B6EM95_MYTGA|nr:Hypothetical predicted protein [Mytilus galloprovincialis]